MKTVNDQKLFTVFAKKLHCRCFTRSQVSILFLKEIFKYFDLKIIGKYLQNRKVIQKDLKTVVSYVGTVIVLVPRSLMVVSPKLMRLAVIIAEVFKMTC